MAAQCHKVERIGAPTGVKFYLLGYEYRNNKKLKEGKMELICTDSTCNRTITVDNELNVVGKQGLNVKPHLHGCTDEGRVYHLVMQQMHGIATTTQEDLRQAFTRIIMNQEEHLRTTISFEKNQRKFQAWRQQSRLPPPQTIADWAAAMQEREDVKKSLDGKTFFRGLVGNHSAVFMSSALEELVSLPAVTLHVDGTFKAVPNMPEAKQTLVLMVSFEDGEAYPFAWVVMRRRNRACYRDIFLYIKSIVPRMSPSSVLCDFETALQQGVNDAFPGIHIAGCWFHYIRALLRNRGRLGLTADAIKTHEWARKAWQMAKALPLLPPNYIYAGIQQILRKSPENLGNFVTYLTNQWYPLREQLSCWMRLKRTNNEIEASHRFLTNRCGIRSPAWDFLGIEAEYSHRCQVSLTDPRPRRRYPEYRPNDERIRAAMVDLFNGGRTIQTFLEYMGHCAANVEATEFIEAEDDPPSIRDHLKRNYNNFHHIHDVV